MLDPNFWKRFETNVNWMYYYAWWLFNTGIVLTIGATCALIILILQYFAVANM